MSPARRVALIAGLLYFSTHLTSVAAAAIYGSTTGRSALPTTSTPILIGVMLEIALALGVVGTGVVLLPVLRPYAPALAPAFLALRSVEAAIICVGALPMLTVVQLRADLPSADAATLVATLTGLHQAAFLVGQGLVISVNTLVISTLLLRSALVPAWIGRLGLVGGMLVLAGNTLQLFGIIASGGSWAGILAAPAFAFEISLAGYLVLRGFRRAIPEPAGSPHLVRPVPAG